MANYISSNANRFYVATETAYGTAANITAGNRFPAVRLQAHQALQPAKRLDKTGTRTFFGTSASSRRKTAFEARTYLTSWSGMAEPSYGALFRAALGGKPQISAGLQVAGFTAPAQYETTAPHGLSSGAAVSFSGEIRFVTGMPSATAFVLNVPFTNTPATGATLAPTVTYSLATGLPSVTLYDYWDPSTTVSRFVTGCAVDTFQVALNGDFHEFTFAGPAADLIDSSSFASGTDGLTIFPIEPTLVPFDYSIVPGHLGQVWLGSTPNQFFTLTEAHIEIKNHIETRGQEFGSSYPRAISPGPREVASTFGLFVQDDMQTAALYQAAKGRNIISAMLQLGQQQGQLMGIYMPNVMPEIPNYNDSETRLRWQFKNNMAQGTANDEIVIAFA